MIGLLMPIYITDVLRLYKPLLDVGNARLSATLDSAPSPSPLRRAQARQPWLVARQARSASGRDRQYADFGDAAATGRARSDQTGSRAPSPPRHLGGRSPPYKCDVSGGHGPCAPCTP